MGPTCPNKFWVACPPSQASGFHISSLIFVPQIASNSNTKLLEIQIRNNEMIKSGYLGLKRLTDMGSLRSLFSASIDPCKRYVDINL
jgi:hypothetical protein